MDLFYTMKTGLLVYNEAVTEEINKRKTKYT
jgi:hypothetical protein